MNKSKKKPQIILQAYARLYTNEFDKKHPLIFMTKTANLLMRVEFELSTFAESFITYKNYSNQRTKYIIYYDKNKNKFVYWLTGNVIQIYKS